MSPLRQAVDEYLALRRGLGFSLRLPGAMLRQFATFCERAGAPYVTRELARRWAQQPAHAQPSTWASRLGAVRRFAQFWSASDPRTEVPPLGLLPHRYHRKPSRTSIPKMRSGVSSPLPDGFPPRPGCARRRMPRSWGCWP